MANPVELQLLVLQSYDAQRELGLLQAPWHVLLLLTQLSHAFDILRDLRRVLLWIERLESVMRLRAARSHNQLLSLHIVSRIESIYVVLLVGQYSRVLALEHAASALYI